MTVMAIQTILLILLTYYRNVLRVWGSNPEPIKSPKHCQWLSTVATLIVTALAQSTAHSRVTTKHRSPQRWAPLTPGLPRNFQNQIPWLFVTFFMNSHDFSMTFVSLLIVLQLGSMSIKLVLIIELLEWVGVEWAGWGSVFIRSDKVNQHKYLS